MKPLINRGLDTIDIDMVDDVKTTTNNVNCLPGFRFHPTNEELIEFYLRRKVDQRITISIDQLIKHLHVYNYDPWDLPNIHEELMKEMYFFCKRGRKYKNSARPNRVTPSGFWKATGIDLPIYSTDRNRECIGLKKTLVFYRGIAGKGAKTEWMMHEFRLSPTATHDHSNKIINNSIVDQEAEVWTICRIFAREGALRKSVESGILRKDNNSIIESNSNQSYIRFASTNQHDHHQYSLHRGLHHQDNEIIVSQEMDDHEFINYATSWDELGPVVYTN